MLNHESLFNSENNLAEKLQGALLQIARKDERLKIFENENNWLKEQLRQFKRGQFGSKSERWETTEQGLLFNEAEALSQNPDPNESVEVEVKAHKKLKGHRKPLPDDLPREVVKIELPADELFSEDGLPLKIIGWEISEKLKYEPAQISVIEYHRAKYGVDYGDYAKTAPPVPSIIPKGIASPELLSAIVVGKYADGLPLYRLEEIFGRQNIDLTRGTMARWVIQVAESLQPIWNILSDRLLANFYVACDETHVQVLKENGRPAEAKSWMWVRSTPFGEKKIILFDYNSSRSGAVAKDLFADYKGYLQCDGLNAYDQLEEGEIVRIGCNMHSRRRFEAAAVIGSKSGQSYGEKGLEFYQKIYALEEVIKEKPPDERFAIRNEIARPIFEEMKSWAEDLLAKVPQKSKVGNAFSYFINEYEYLTGYLKDGRLNPDNGFTERVIRKFAIGRNNWMFSDSEGGAGASALLYSLVITAKINGVNPYRALTKILTDIPMANSCEDYERLAEIILNPKALV